MTLARQLRHKAGRYPSVNRRPVILMTEQLRGPAARACLGQPHTAPECACPAGWKWLLSSFDVATYGPHHFGGGQCDGGRFERCPLFRMPQCRSTIVPVDVTADPAYAAGVDLRELQRGLPDAIRAHRDTGRTSFTVEALPDAPPAPYCHECLHRPPNHHPECPLS
jgi:hypothetical protein